MNTFLSTVVTQLRALPALISKEALRIWIFLAVLIGFYFDWELQNILLLCLVITQLVKPISVKGLVALMVGALILIPVCALLGKDIRANQLAVFVVSVFALAITTHILTWIDEKSAATS